MHRRRKALVTGLATAIGLSGCTTLPRSGPDDRDIRNKASLYLASDKRQMPYALVDLSDKVLSYFPASGVQSFSAGFGPTRKGVPSLPLGVGDIIQVTLFESAAGGLFVPSDAGSRPGNFITLPNQTIDTRGSISVPYAGKIRAAGRLPEEVQAEIERRLADRAIEPQAVITIIESRSSQVSVLGDVNGASKIQITPSGEKVLDAISAAGGITSPGPETYVTLQRNNTTATVPFEALLANPRENIYVYPGDVIYVNRERRTFLAFGASGLSGRVDFEESNLTLAEAIGKAGGLLDDRADPREIFLYRIVDAETLQKMGIPATAKVDGGFPVIFRLNVRNPAGFFIAQRFAMQDKDILYISNADSVETVKVFDIIGSATSAVSGPVIQGAAVASAVN